jgi:hypothetical protein
MRYADPQQGRILIGGTDIRALTQEDLMRQISVFFQDVYLFDDTIANNIRLGKADATDAEIEAAARTARCHDFIMAMPEGYQTRVGDIGGKLSGGEKQRISIARALLKNAPIIILDEPTAALDTESEVAVQQAIDAQNRYRHHPPPFHRQRRAANHRALRRTSCRKRARTANCSPKTACTAGSGRQADGRRIEQARNG